MGIFCMAQETQTRALYEPRAYYTERSMSEVKGKHHILTHTEEYWYQRIYLQGSNGETDIETRLMDMGRGKEKMTCMERVTWKLILPYVK